MAKKPTTDIWDLYQTGLDYKTKIGHFAKVDLHWDFYNSKQWRGIKSTGQPEIQLNVIRQSADFKTSSLMSQNVAIKYNAENSSDIMDNVPPEMVENMERNKAQAELLTKMIEVKFEKDKMSKKLRECVLNAAITGDMGLYVYFDHTKETGQPEKGDICTDVIDGTNIFFADANVSLIEKQEWIITSGRQSVTSLREEAKKYGADQDEIDKITADNDYEYQIGRYGKLEMDYAGDNGKSTYVIKFYKKDGKVFWQKKTKHATIRSEVDLGIKRYPIAYANWGTIKGSMHGMSDTEGVIPNQIAINQLHSLTVLWMRHNAFGKVVYDKTRINNWSNSVTAAIGMDGDITGAVQQIRSGDFNQAIVNYAELLMSATKSVNGVNDAALGQVDPKNTSAIITTIKQSGIPLENVQANLYQMVEDWAMIVGDFITAKYNDRYVPIKQDDKNAMAKYSKPSEDFMYSVTIDVGPSNYFNETVGINSLDNLYSQGKLTDVQYFSRIKDFNIIPDAEGLQKDAEEKVEMEQQMLQQQAMAQQQAQQQVQQAPEVEEEQGGIDEIQEMLSSMSPEMQQQFMSLSPEQQQQYLEEFTQQQ